MELILDNVSKTLKKANIINGVSLRLTGGHIYGLRGYNGSGKTMLMRLMAGLLRPSAGSVSIDGKILGRDIDFPPSLGLLLETPAFLQNYTGVENLQVIAGLRAVTNEAQIRDVINRVGLDPEDRRKYRKYSLGMKQRLGIACAIFESPDILLLDEPTNALDTSGVLMFRNIIHNERERGALVVLTSHEKNQLDELADIIYTIEYGRIVKEEKMT